jgi:RimJ/RimL family protein N-acetyltransferase
MSADAFTIRIPRLVTPRLLLREPRVEDFEAVAVNAADESARAHVGGPLDRREAWRRFMSSAGNWVVTGMGWWAVELRGQGFIGSVGVFRRETSPELEIGWTIDRPHWGRGYATEAAKAALDHAMLTLGDRVIAHVDPENAPSNAVAAKIGMRREAEVDFYGGRCWRYAYGRDA